MSIAYAPASDLLGHSAPLSETLAVPLLGVPVVYSSNSAAVIACAARALERWSALPPALIAPGAPARVTIIVHPLGAGDPALPPAERFVFRAHGDCFLAAAGGSLMSAHMAAGVATAFVTPELASDEANLRHSVIECLGFMLVNRRDRTPVHAAAVVRNGRAVLLVGQSAAGKSTLCYACVRAGFGLMAEDTVSVSLSGALRLWGHASAIHLLPDAPRLFPELAGLTPQVRANGKLKLAIDVAALGPERLVTHADRATVCLVERAPGQASRLEPLPAADAVAALSDPREPGFDLLRERAPAVARALTATGAYRLTVGADPAAAMALLAHLTDEG